jgi:hypothetical protein
MGLCLFAEGVVTVHRNLDYFFVNFSKPFSINLCEFNDMAQKCKTVY